MGETVIRLDCPLSRQGRPSCNEFFVLPSSGSLSQSAAAVVILALTMGGGAAGGGVGY